MSCEIYLISLLEGDAESVFLRDNFNFFIISIFISVLFSGETNLLTNKGLIFGVTLLAVLFSVNNADGAIPNLLGDFVLPSSLIIFKAVLFCGEA
tara:strand:+ start:16 stop:300 length:285 start_codon:yes stop_codon:yes gene_type:complete